ncbi:MAG: hypothetical protein M3Y80_10270 [Verrucomicrobiota bacterium]|nr:hypothetical protein [Verrucomicrobiota bacterium]
MMPGEQPSDAASATAEEVLRVIYGDDLEGCSVSVDAVAAAIRAGLQEQISVAGDLRELHGKAFEAVQLLATPPADGSSLSPEDLRSLLGERLDKIRELATQVLSATTAASTGLVPDEGG